MYIFIVILGLSLLIISSIAYTLCLWYSNHTICSRQSEIDLSVTDTTRCHDEEKSNNLQNEENFRRYANPLKNSTCSLRSVSNVEMNPMDLSASVVSAGPSGLSRSQMSIFKSPKEFSNDFDVAVTKPLNSQSLIQKTQNFDVDKNIQQSSTKDFDKQRLGKCFSSSTNTPITQPQLNFSSNKSHQNNNVNNNNDTLTLHI